jgi:hypothetical protein
VSRVHYWIELAVRPVIATMPSMLRGIVFNVLSITLHLWIKSRTGHSETWTLKNTNHDLRDWLSPRYAWRHGYNEVLEWYESEGFQVFSLQSPGEYRKLFRRRLWGVAVSGQKLTAQSVRGASLAS